MTSPTTDEQRKLIERVTSYAAYEIGQGTMPHKIIREMEQKGLDRDTAQAIVKQLTTTYAQSQRKSQHQEGIQKMITGGVVILIVLVIAVALAQSFQNSGERIGGLSLYLPPSLALVLFASHRVYLIISVEAQMAG